MKPNSPDDANIYTVTMAEVYASQGHFDKAAQIYRRLLEERPHEETLIKALAKTEKRISEQKQTQKKDLVALFSKWIRMLEAGNRLGAMQKLKKSPPGDEP